ncbi:MAG: NnrU family protein [Gammaproteobacteria bacterium]
MALLILGLLIFLGAHSTRLVAEGWRQRQLARFGTGRWKAMMAAVSIVGFVLLVWGFGLARQQPTLLYVPPTGLRHVNELLTVIAFVLLAAAYVPRNHFKAALGHPMTTAIVVWATGHLLVNGMLHDVLLFGAFLAWAAINLAVSRRRDRAAGIIHAQGTLGGDALALLIGIAAWVAFAFWLHARWIGADPFA